MVVKIVGRVIEVIMQDMIVLLLGRGLWLWGIQIYKWLIRGKIVIDKIVIDKIVIDKFMIDKIRIDVREMMVMIMGMFGLSGWERWR